MLQGAVVKGSAVPAAGAIGGAGAAGLDATGLGDPKDGVPNGTPPGGGPGEAVRQQDGGGTDIRELEDVFLKLLRDHRDTLGSKQRFVGLLKDYFPREPATVSLMDKLHDMGALGEIERAERITKNLAYRLAKRLTDEHGKDRRRAEGAVALLCVCYGARTLGKPCDLDWGEG
jgi:hypothetical protein